MPAAVNERTRFPGFDLIRLVSFIAIAFFHISLIHYYQHEVPLSQDSVISKGIEVYARSLAFSGFTVIFLTCMLIAYTGHDLRRRMRLFSFLIGGWIVFCLFMGFNYTEFLAWDVYPLIMLGILTGTIAERAGNRWLTGIGLLGMALLCIPFWEFSDFVTMSDFWRNVLGFAICDTDIAEWPILPWIGIVWVGYVAGVALRRASAVQSPKLRVERNEAIAWVVLLAASIPQWGPFYDLQLGDRFGCEAYRMPPLVFWSHLIWPLFLIRLSVDPRVNARLLRSPVAVGIGRLAISRKFWAAYFLNFMIAHLLSWIANVTGITGSPSETNWIVFFAIIFLPLTELATRAVMIVQARIEAYLARRKAGAHASG